MATLTVQDRDDAYGPRYSDGTLWAGGIGLLLCLNSLLASIAVRAQPIVICLLVGAVVGLTAYCFNVVTQRRLRLHALREGIACDGLVVARSANVYNGFGMAAEPEYMLTVQFAIDDAVRATEMRVTDRVFLRAQVGRPIAGRALASRPPLWVPAS